MAQPQSLVGAGALGAEQNDPRPPQVLLRRVAVLDRSEEPINVGKRDGNGNARAQPAGSRAASPQGISPGIPSQTRLISRNHCGHRLRRFDPDDLDLASSLAAWRRDGGGLAPGWRPFPMERSSR